MALAQLNRDFEGGMSTLPPSTWDEWLWGSDLHEKLTPDVALNRCHLLGLLVARYRARTEPDLMRVRLNAAFPRMVHGSVFVNDMSLRQLRDATEDLQMHWIQQYLPRHEDASVAVDALMTRFGDILLRLQSDPGSVVRDDLASLEVGRAALTAAAMRRFVSVFCVLYRHLHLSALAQEEEGKRDTPHPGVENHHVQAGMEDFYRHAMLSDLPPAARILYKLDFQGMYHCVTQVVYMHFPSYERRNQVELETIRASACAPAHCLSVLLQLCPTASVLFEDDRLVPGWNWMLMAGGALYLVHWDAGSGPAGDAALSVFVSPNIWTLVARAELLGDEECAA